MAFYVKYRDQETDSEKEIRYIVRSSAESEAERLREEGQLDVIVMDEMRRNIKKYEPRNLVSMILFAFGIVLIILSLVIGMIIGIMDSRLSKGLSLWNALVYWIYGGAAGFLFIGIAEIITWLQRIHAAIQKSEGKPE
ncbi:MULTISPECIES: hypothetical protein [unclassified Paenibacillus]|uniref:hypothetical protein n=1 Tax=unclassified Paenibacillus TaxID=185978 RepID=UPI000839D6FF|nr:MULTISPECIES: hypothetical protein [unclassified Paenibacillus]NWL87386.1 hypothetical protein [Paenibacillus sp. 79R4]